MQYWEIVADKLSAAGWTWGYCSTVPTGLALGSLTPVPKTQDQSPIYGIRQALAKVR
jgi:hypothetical protein